MSNTLFIGKVYHSFDELPSTNDYARDLIAKSKPPEGTAIRAASQSAGRGQFGSRWESAPGQNLTLSVILYPQWLPVQEQFRLNEAVALAVRDAVAETISGYPVAVAIKWPNDIYLNEKKTAGILLQNTLSQDRLQASVVGIGLNVNQTLFPPEIPNATSLAQATGQPYALEAVMSRLFEHLERRYLQLKGGRIEALRDDFHQHLWGRGEPRQFATPDGHAFTGVITGVSAEGKLIVETDAGEQRFGLKEIRMV